MPLLTQTELPKEVGLQDGVSTGFYLRVATCHSTSVSQKSSKSFLFAGTATLQRTGLDLQLVYKRKFTALQLFACIHFVTYLSVHLVPTGNSERLAALEFSCSRLDVVLTGFVS
jgi:hypothetical protein